MMFDATMSPGDVSQVKLGSKRSQEYGDEVPATKRGRWDSSSLSEVWDSSSLSQLVQLLVEDDEEVEQMPAVQQNHDLECGWDNVDILEDWFLPEEESEVADGDLVDEGLKCLEELLQSNEEQVEDFADFDLVDEDEVGDLPDENEVEDLLDAIDFEM